MKKGKIIIISSIIGAVFVCALAYFGFNLYNEKKYGDDRTRDNFSVLCRYFSNPDKSPSLNDVLSDFNNFKAIQISLNGKVYEAYPENNVFNDEDKSNFVNCFHKNVQDKNGNIWTIKAAVYTLRPVAIYYYGKISFLIILTATVLTIIICVLIGKNCSSTDSKQILNKNNLPAAKNNSAGSESSLEQYNENSSEKHVEYSVNDKVQVTSVSETSADNKITEKSDESENDSVSEENSENIENNNNSSDSEQNSSALKANSISDNSAETKEKAENLSPFDENIVFPDTDSSKQKGNNKNLSEKSETLLPFSSNKINFMEENNSIFSEETGFVKKELFLSKLDNEITKAGSFELDLALFIIKIPGFSYGLPVSEKINDILLNIFQFKEFVFEYKDYGYAIIKPDMNIDDAENLADTLSENLSEVLKNTSMSKTYIGISSVNSRLISATRLENEAEQALNHAVDENERIIAFHVDPEKYREFIKNN